MELLRFSVLGTLLFTLLGFLSPFALAVSNASSKDGHFTSPSWYPSPYGGVYGTWQESYAKAWALVSQMTLAEKVNLTTGVGFGESNCVGNSGSVPRMNIKSFCLQDSPLGVRFADEVSAFPAGVTIGATFDSGLMELRGRLMGLEAAGKGVHVLLGPVVGPLGRNVLGGRNWEGSGADPYLSGQAASWGIKGIQSAKVQACVKHFIGNEQEHFRGDGGSPDGSSSNIDDRTMHELYLWPFADAVKAGVACVMCSYNQINNSYACQNSKLMNGILKDELGFSGFILSDWLAQRAGVDSIIAGLDQTMPGDGPSWALGSSFWGSRLSQGVLNGSIPVDRLDDAVTRILASSIQVGQDQDFEDVNFSSFNQDDEGPLYPRGDDKNPFNPNVTLNKHVNVQNIQGSHAATILQIASESVTLLKNVGNILPLPRDSTTPLALFGSDAGNVTVKDWPNQCSDRSCNKGVLGQGWGSGTCNYPYLTTPQEVITGLYPNTQTFNTDTFNAQMAKAAQTAGMTCLVFITADSGEFYLVVEGNQGDRNSYNAWHGGDNLVKAVANSCNNTIVVMHSVGAMSMEAWIEHPNVKAVVMAHLPGQEAGGAIASVLTGEINACGKLPYTVGKQVNDYGTNITYKNPNKDGSSPQLDFDEGVYIDYRHFDKYDITPRFEFGYGLSYSNFTFSNLRVTEVERPQENLPPAPTMTIQPQPYGTDIPPVAEATWPSSTEIPYRVPGWQYPYIDSPNNITKGEYAYPPGYSTIQQPVSPAGGGEGGNPTLWDIIYEVHVSLTNNGPYPGKYVTQLYIGFPDCPFDTPVRQLRGFNKVSTEVGETVDVVLTLTRRDLSVWDTVKQNWVMPINGDGKNKGYTIYVGHSSRDLPISCNTASTCTSSNGGGYGRGYV